MLSEGFQNPKIGFQNPRLPFFPPQKNSLEHAKILSEDCQIPIFSQIQSNNRVYLITVWVRNNRVETSQNPRLPFFRKKKQP